MSQYNSRIYIKVPNIDLWKKVSKEKTKEYSIDLYNNKNNTFISKGCLDESELSGFVQRVVESLEGKCIVVADTTNINVDPYAYYVYYFGDKVKDDTIYFDEFDDDNDEMDQYFISDINDIKNWIKLTNVRLNSIEKEIVTNEILKDTYNFPIELVYTNLGDRIENNEHLKLNQEVYLDKGEYLGKKAIEVFTNEGKSIGFIDDYLSKDILQLIKRTKIKIKGIICEYQPLSKRGKNSRKALVSITIV